VNVCLIVLNATFNYIVAVSFIGGGNPRNYKELPWSWSYGSWIYNYLCSQCLSLLKLWVRIPLMALWVFNATFNIIAVISWRSVLLGEETRVPWENHRSADKRHQLLSHNVASSNPNFLLQFQTYNLFITMFNCQIQSHSVYPLFYLAFHP
jgi:hypothetical protein